MKKLILTSLHIGIICVGYISAAEFDKGQEAPYHMVTASLINNEIRFEQQRDFDQVLKDGFFRVKRPTDIDIERARDFAHQFNQTEKYTSFGYLNEVNGYLMSDKSQVIRFTLESDYWNKKGWDLSKVEINDPNYSPDIQKVGHQLKDLGIVILKSILNKFEIPQDLWDRATAGCTAGQGSYFLNFNSYDPKLLANKLEGLGEHTDWSMITVLDAIGEGLQANINGRWRPIILEDGYLTINFGEPLQKLLPKVRACLHRVPRQTEKPRVSIAMFVDPRVGPYAPTVDKSLGAEGMVWDWDPQSKQLVNAETVMSYFKRMSKELYNKIGTSQQELAKTLPK